MMLIAKTGKINLGNTVRRGAPCQKKTWERIISESGIMGQVETKTAKQVAYQRVQSESRGQLI